MSLKERERKLVIRANERGREREQATEKVKYKSTHTDKFRYEAPERETEKTVKHNEQYNRRIVDKHDDDEKSEREKERDKAIERCSKVY